MKRIILYGSVYGTSRRYAEELSGRTGIPAVSARERADLSDSTCVIHIGGLYAGGVEGLKDTLQKLPQNREYDFLLVTVGLADPKDPKNIDNIRASLEKQLPKELYQRVKLFCLRGGIDYKKLNLKHRTMMWMMYQHLKNMPVDQRPKDAQAIIDTYNSKVDFVDFDSLAPIEEALEERGTDE